MSYLGMIAFRGIFFGLYDTYKDKAENNFQKLYISYFSTVAALIGIYPFDTIRRRLMMTSGQNYKYGSYRQFIRYVYQEQGFRGFFIGIPITFMEALTIGTMFLLFDQLFCMRD
jgi:solute carrier family 25 (adenine nucleotide translocator) protein 4/5/6/31